MIAMKLKKRMRSKRGPDSLVVTFVSVSRYEKVCTRRRGDDAANEVLEATFLISQVRNVRPVLGAQSLHKRKGYVQKKKGSPRVVPHQRPPCERQRPVVDRDRAARRYSLLHHGQTLLSVHLHDYLEEGVIGRKNASFYALILGENNSRS